MVCDLVFKKKKVKFFLLVLSATVLFFVYVNQLSSKLFDPEKENYPSTPSIAISSDIQTLQNIPDCPSNHVYPLKKKVNYESSHPISPNTVELETGNLNPPTQQWAHAQIYKAMVYKNWTYPSVNEWGSCSSKTYYFSNLRTIFTGTPKTGCSNWLIALLNAEGVLRKEIDPKKVKFVHGGLTTNRRVSAMLRKKLVTPADLDKAFSFAVIRNPWTRMVSGYRDKVSSEKTQGGSFRGIGMAIVAKSRNISDPKLLEKLYPTFDEYARWLVFKNGRLDAHFSPQIRTLCIPNAMYDYIVPLEHSARLSKDVWRRIQASDTPLLGSYDKSSDPRNQKSAVLAKRWLSQLPSEIVNQLYKIYEADFILLNYSNFTHPDFPLPLHF